MCRVVTLQEFHLPPYYVNKESSWQGRLLVNIVRNSLLNYVYKECSWLGRLLVNIIQRHKKVICILQCTHTKVQLESC